MRTLIPLARLFTALVAVAFSLAPATARAADHRDGPLFITESKGALGERDINDVFIFRSAQTPANTVMIFTFQPFPDIFTPRTFLPATPYVFNIDHNGDALAEMQFKVTFSGLDRNGVQKVKVQHTQNRRSETVAEGVVGHPMPLSTGGQLIADIFDDPFFFDAIAARNNFAFTSPGDDFFRGINVGAIVLEVPTAFLLTGSTGARIDLWCTVLRGSMQIDRMGWPSINSFLIPRARRDAFNAGLPVNDRRDFRVDVISSLMAAPFNRNQGDAQVLADMLLPDILIYDCTQATAFPNGRKLSDDVIDTELKLLLNDPAATDGVDDSREPFLAVFPYLKSANP